MNRTPDVVLHTNLLIKATVCSLEQELIALYQESYQRCLNSIHGNDNCITTPNGVVYVRIYLD